MSILPTHHMTTFQTSFSSSPLGRDTVTSDTNRSSRRPGITRQRLGCLTCRHRRKKCDHQYPICGHCMRLNLVCKREKPRDVIPGSKRSPARDLSSSPSSTSSAKSSGQYSCLSLSISRAPDTSRLGDFLTSNKGQGRRLMLTYYTQVLAGLLTTNHDNNSFLTVFLPMAMDSLLLQKSLIAWSSAHLSCYSKDHLIPFLGHRSSALSIMATSISNQHNLLSEAEVTLATCLVLCSMEVAFGDTKDWYQHLLGAKQVIMSMKTVGPGCTILRGPACFSGSHDGRWLLRNFAYHDVLGSLTSNEPPLIPGRYWLENKASLIDSYMGYSSEILAVLAQVCALNTKDDGETAPSHVMDELMTFDIITDNDSRQTEDFWEISEDLERELECWNCPDTSDYCLADLAESHRSTALIALYRKQRSYCWEEEQPDQKRLSVIERKISERVTNTLYHIEKVPIGSLPESGTLFPLFIAGGDAVNQGDIDFVHLRLKALHDFQHFGNTARAIDVLEELWRLRISGVKGPRSRAVDWMDILESKRWKLMLS